jgi:transposase
VQAFAQLLTERRGRELKKWMTAASTLPELRAFVTGLRRDQDAIAAGFTLPWSSGVVEGHINRIKMLERQMYGRATLTFSSAASSSSANDRGSRLTQSVPEPVFTCRRQSEPTIF